MADTKELIRYAEAEIKDLGLGAGGKLRTEFVVAFDDAGDGKIRLSDGQGLDAICDSVEKIDQELGAMVDWINE